MPIPGPGTAISMDTIATEFGGTVPHSLSEYYRGGGLVPNSPTNTAIPTSGQIAMGDFYGSANRVSVPLTISANTANYDVYTNRGPTYVAGASDITLTINPAVVVSSTSTGSYALLVPSSFSPGDTVTIVNNGTIVGMGGNGGQGGSSGSPGFNSPGIPGGVGGSALYVNRPTTVTNNGTIAGAGGGGGGGGAQNGSPSVVSARRAGGGGGGGAGTNPGAGGAAGVLTVTPAPSGPAQAGSAGTATTGGAGGAGSPVPGGWGPGGPGGGLGAAGTNGTDSLPTAGSRSPNGAGGAAGNYIVGNPFVTWPATGTRLGGVA